MKQANKRLNIASALLFSAALATSGLTYAGDKSHKDKKALPNQPFAYAEVVQVTPVYREIRVSSPLKECWQEPVRHTQQRHHDSNSVGGALAGGLIGGIIGHQFGQGRGNKLATAVGTIIGAQAGHDASRGSAYAERHYTRYEDRCELQERVSYEQVIDGYRVEYRYRGNAYQTQMPYDPGERLKVKVTVQPVF